MHLMQQSHHQGIFPGSTRSRVCRFVPVLSTVCKNIFAVPSSRFITVCPGRHMSTPGLINQDHPGGHPFHPGGHPVHPSGHPVNIRWTPVPPGEHTVHPGQHTVHYGFLRFITVHYGSHYGSSRSTHGSLRFITVHYGSLRFITVHYGALRFITGIVTIPVNTRFITVHYGSSWSTHGSSRSTPGLNFLPGLMPV